MTQLDLLLIFGVALVCGTFAQWTSGYSRGGWIVNLMLCLFGAMLGVYLARALNAPRVFNMKFADADFPILYALIGSVLMAALVSLVVKPGRR